MNRSTEWAQHQPHANGTDKIKTKHWGRTHWDVLSFLHTCVEKDRGIVDADLMRCNPDLHREVGGLTANRTVSICRSPTRLVGCQVDQHDDWSCLDDLAAEGFIEAEYQDKRKNFHITFGFRKMRVSMTEKGKQTSRTLREYRKSGFDLDKFSYEVTK